MELPDLEYIEETPVMRFKQGYIPVLYEAVGDVDLSISDNWPSYVCCKPLIGETVESLSGRRLEIKGIVHKTDEKNQAILVIQLGKDTGGQHEQEGTPKEVDW